MNARAIARIAGLVLLFTVLAPIHMAGKAALGRSRWPRRFLAAAAWIIGVRVRREGALPAIALVVANHVSWLDILVLGGATGCAFVSKDSLGHPLIHWLADQNRTIYVNREARRDVTGQAATVSAALDGGELVAFFPEGTVGPGDRLLPFRAPLFAAVAEPAQHSVWPVALDYGWAAREISWFEEEGRANVARLLSRKGTLPVTVRVLDCLPAGDRKQLAAHASAQIAEALGFKSPAHSPIGETR